MIIACHSCRASGLASFNRVHDGWRIATRVAGSLLAIAFVLGHVMTPRLAGAQTRAGVPRIGILELRAAPSATNPEFPTAAGFRQGLRELGYVEGQNILVERRYADGQPERAAAIAAELVQLKVDVILTTSPATREAASKATRSIPIVTVSGSDPEREGWARSLARPGGNVTGLTVTYPGLSAKRFEILKSAFPSLARMAVLIDPTEVPNPKQVVLDMEAGAKQLGLQLQILEVRGPEDFAAAFALARQHHAQALYVLVTNLMAVHRVRLAGLAASDRLPSIGDFRMMADAGLVMSYGVDLHDLGRRAITHLHKILEGAQPGDLAVERPTRFQLIVNLKAAKAMGLTIPQALLLRADEVIQ